MLCDKCWGMLRGHEGRVWKGTYDLHFNHHADLQQLQTSAKSLCGICSRLHDEWTRSEDTRPASNAVINSLVKLQEKKPEQEMSQKQPLPKPEKKKHFSSTASLSTVRDVDGHDLFRLDFRLTCGEKTRKRTFVLKQIDDAVAPFRTPTSKHMSSDEVFRQAIYWCNKCKCAKPRPSWHPSRLIDLHNLKERAQLEGGRTVLKGRQGWGKLNDVTVRIVEKEDDDFPQTEEPSWSEQEVVKGTCQHGNRPRLPHASLNNRYVTLSHCWGKHQPKVLDNLSKNELKKGIKLRDLPKTYKQAIKFAAQMEDVGWIWIDSLCIIQDDERDWTHESSDMQRVYRESFLNISATASQDSEGGLYHDRVPKALWEDEVNLKVDGIHGLERAAASMLTTTHILVPPAESYWFSAILNWCWPTTGGMPRYDKQLAQSKPKEVVAGDLPTAGVRRCILVDVAHWDDIINKAPVNVRAWVLQERLLAPRVLHFCKGQIAWECAEFEDSEGYPTEVPKFVLQDDQILRKPLNKGLTPDSHGRELRAMRLRGEPDPDAHLIGRGLHELVLWSRIVEDFSRLNLTNSKDKLVALSGIAEFMAREVMVSKSGSAVYCAGLWNQHLACQLLWKIEPVFRHHDRTFIHPSRRPRDSQGRIVYRAPTFSWASVDAQHANGITYGEITDQDLLIDVDQGYDSVSMILKVPKNLYGEVTGGHIMIWGQLRAVKLCKGDKGRYYWFLRNRGGVCTHGTERDELENEEHRNVYLDCPEDDVADILGMDNIVYCLPAALGSRTEHEASKYIICLLLRHIPEGDDQLKGFEGTRRRGVYRRIGLTKLSTWADKHAHKYIRDQLPTDIDYPQRPHKYNENGPGRSLIYII